MLRFDAVSVSFDGRPTVADVDLAVGARELVVMVGPSGAGKTTLLRLAAGLAAPTAGRVTNRARRTAMVFQEPHLLPWESALDNAGVALAAIGIGRREARPEAERWLLRLGLRREDLDKRPAALSGGMRTRVALARAFVGAADLVLLDEPFASLDLGLRRDLQTLLRDLVVETGIAALFVTHDPTEAVRLADRLVVLSGRPGRVAADLPFAPTADPALVWSAAADLARRPEFAPVIAGLGDVVRPIPDPSHRNPQPTETTLSAGAHS